jgi:ubiquinone/menaquinone biosynthesis C-methylase UbiE
MTKNRRNGLNLSPVHTWDDEAKRMASLNWETLDRVNFRLLKEIHRLERRLITTMSERQIVLDAGCGLGHNTLLFHIMGATHVVGAEISSEMIRFAKNNWMLATQTSGHFVRCDIRYLPLRNEYFSFVVSFSVIDHISLKIDRELALSEMTRVAMSGARIIVTVPNSLNILWRMVNWFDHKVGLLKYGYEHWFSPLELVRMFQGTGLHTQYVETSNFLFPPALGRKRAPTALWNSLSSLTTKLGKTCLGKVAGSSLLVLGQKD